MFSSTATEDTAAGAICSVTFIRFLSITYEVTSPLHLHDYLYSNLYSHLLYITYIWITISIFIFYLRLFVFAFLFLSLIYIYLSLYVYTTISILICRLFPSTATKPQLAPLVPLHQYESYYRVAKTHRMPYLWRSFSAEEPYN